MGYLDKIETIRSLAIVGATGLVGRECLQILDEAKVRIPKIRLLASEASYGDSLDVGGESHGVEVLSESSFDEIEVAFFSVPTEVCQKYIPHALEAGSLVIDDSSAFRMRPDVPLVVPEVNGSVLRGFEAGVFSIPNCTTTPLALCLKPLLDEWGLSRVVVSTYQSVSGAGQAAYEELSAQTIQLMNGAATEPKVFPHRIAFNCLPMIGPLQENGASEEEEKIGRELRKILEIPELKVASTAVRVPTFCGHAMSVNVELNDDFGEIEAVRERLEKFDGLKVIDRPDSHIYPTNEECARSNDTYVGRIRRDRSVASGVSFWVVTDNLRKGAALNALQSLNTLYTYQQLH